MRHLLSFFLLAVFLVLAGPVQSQTPSQSSWEMLYRDWLTTEDADYGEDVFEMLSDIAESKLDINQLTREQLEQFPFLSAQQIEDIMAYVDRYRPLRSLSELQMITSLDTDMRRLLTSFLDVGNDKEEKSKTYPSLSTLLHDGRHSLMASARIPLYERKGDRNDNGKGYLGYRYRHDIRYQYTYRDLLKFGLTAAQDAGEPFFSKNNRWGYDHYSFYFQLRRLGRLEELNLGMYRVQMGMGLVMNTGFHLGKLAVLQSLGRNTHVLTAHASRSYANYLRGAAATLRLADQWRLTAFASYRPLDATLNKDGTVHTIVTDGYHRTNAEIEKKHNTHLTDLGARLSYNFAVDNAKAYANLNILYSHFDRVLKPYEVTSSEPSVSQLYRRYAQAGSSFFNASLDYGFTNARFSFSGETALNGDGALAAIHSLSYRMNTEWSLMLLHRYYGLRYTAYHAYSFSEGGSTQNEHGVYLGTSWRPHRRFMMQAYVDYARFKGPRYQVKTASDALDALIRAKLLVFNKLNLEGRYRFHLRQRDNDAHSYLINRYEHRARLRLSFPLLSQYSSADAPSQDLLTLATQADGAFITVPRSDTRSKGLMLSQYATLHLSKFQFNASVGWFHTDDYDSRLYLYEPSILYDFSFPMFYGHGLRYALTARGVFGPWTAMVKFGVTDYFDRSVISSGNQQIDRSSQPDLYLQLRYVF